MPCQAAVGWDTRADYRVVGGVSLLCAALRAGGSDCSAASSRSDLQVEVAMLRGLRAWWEVAWRARVHKSAAAIECFILDRLGKDLAKATQVVAWRKLWRIQDFSYELCVGLWHALPERQC